VTPDSLPHFWCRYTGTIILYATTTAQKGEAMNLLKHRSMRFYLVFFLILTMAVGGSAIAAFADSGTGATVAVNAGNLSESGPTTVSATPVTLNGDDQTTSYALGLTVTDARGNSAGWNLTITSTTFTGTNVNNQLSTSASSIDAVPAVACISGGGHCTNPVNGITYPVGVPAGATAPTPVKFFNAATNSGLGKFTITPTVTIAIPASTIADTYSSTVSVAVVSGP
jgi:putative surface cell wall-binding protein